MLRKKIKLALDDASEETVESIDASIPTETDKYTPLETSPYFHKKIVKQTVAPEAKTKGKSNELLLISDELSESLSRIEFLSPIAHVYNPTVYARDVYSQYVRRYGDTIKKTLFLGMNPGPFGMCQTGVPFGNRSTVVEWLQLSGTIDAPDNPCPGRPILGFNCNREEISGKRFWTFFRELCQTPDTFFKDAYVYNYCPLAFISATGKNITPADVRKQKEQIQRVEKACDCALLQVVRVLEVKVVVAIGKYADEKAKRVLLPIDDLNVKILHLAHPSPRSKQSANWAVKVNDFLRDNNLIEYFTHLP